MTIAGRLTCIEDEMRVVLSVPCPRPSLHLHLARRIDGKTTLRGIGRRRPSFAARVSIPCSCVNGPRNSRLRAGSCCAGRREDEPLHCGLLRRRIQQVESPGDHGTDDVDGIRVHRHVRGSVHDAGYAW